MVKETKQLNLEVGVTLAKSILAAYEQRRGIFESTEDLLEHQIPEGIVQKSKEHANFLFYLICQDHGVKSFRLYARAKALYSKSPEIFEPSHVVATYRGDRDANLAIATGKALGTRFPNETAKQWFQNSHSLLESYHGDARAIFSNSSDSLEAMDRIRQFRGFGPKTSGLLFRCFYGIGFFVLKRADEVPIPVDIHDTRIAILNGLLRITPAPGEITSKNYMKYAKAAQEAWIKVCHVGHMDWLTLDRALWLLGSRGCDPHRHLECCITHNCLTRGHSATT